MEENIHFPSNRHLNAVLHGYPMGCNGVQLIQIQTSINLTNCSAWPLSFGLTEKTQVTDQFGITVGDCERKGCF